MKFPFVSRRKYETSVEWGECLKRIVDLIGPEERKRLGLLPAVTIAAGAIKTEDKRR